MRDFVIGVMAVIILTIGAIHFTLTSLPEGVWVNGVWFSIVQDNLMGGQKYPYLYGYYGFTDCSGHTIWIDAYQSKHEKANTLVHESQHAMTCELDKQVHNKSFNNDTNEHIGIQWATPKWIEWMADNPQLVKYVQENR